ncbi:MAG: GatB/YqeY domain-containing protein [Bdellovibrionales bacterium]|nr:GatB/YqeY domain-containing protein [Bdellovibrionales bacterium]
MSIKAQISEDMKTAMKARESETLSSFRFILSAIKNKEIELRPKDISDSDIIGVLKKHLKQNQDSIEQYVKTGQTESVHKLNAENKVIQKYIPQALSKQETEKLVSSIIAELKATSVKDMGSVMKALKDKSDGKLDSQLASGIVRAQLQS